MPLKIQEIINSLGYRRVGVALLVLCVVLISWSGFIDVKAIEYIDSAVVKAMAAYGGARLLNGIVSMLQEIEVGVVAITAQPFQFLDSINDLVEDYSSVMKIAIGSLVLQKVLIEIASTVLFKWLVSFMGVVLIVSLFFSKRRLSEFVFKCFILVGLVRFVFIFSIVFNGLISQAFIVEKIDNNVAKVNQLSSLVESMESTLPESRRTEIQLEMERLKEKDEIFAGELKAIEAEVKKTEGHITEAERRFQGLQEKTGALDKINVFSDTLEYSEAKIALEVLNEKLHEDMTHLEDFQEKREAIKLDAERLQKELEGGGSGFVANFKSKMASVSVVENIGVWKEKLNSIVPETLNLMALFFFETLIIPLVTFLLLLKGFKIIWSIDVRLLAKREINNLKG